ncbi:leucine/isoleucine/valine transporter permease subunit [Pseudovibrio axinellae]|uniref:Leucine/isoleucine/valine transporter permease subunit n=1 Tax=Pseudovibrio axinellae TaxID=989403 RepID=A0A165XI57_9HYPH|nr:branched-chain amino acid ABC transporter permease [Pseudovibrio axinellae]KZL17723.1 leucine/isoleucine/valine transporter permease subunit [Pseudovibrio axinellae]SER42239.1 amino acid/amide ABC transporter membrane protein 2, HAAT family [Pseudovibrio axinellae]
MQVTDTAPKPVTGFKFNREGATNVAVMAVLLALPLWASSVGEDYYVNLASLITIFAIAGVGLNFAIGQGGMVSFGHAAFFGIGGYTAGIAAFHSFEETLFMSVPFAISGTNQMLIIWVVAMALCGLAALAIGAISLRTEGVYFIMITLAFAQMIYYFAISWPTYGGEDGLSIYLRNQIGAVDTDHALTFFLICFGLLLAAIFVSARLSGSRFGAALGTARMNETRLATSGINPFPIKLTGFIISAMITGLAGALFAELNGFVGPSMLSWHRSGEIMVFVILGGVGRLYGPVIGASLFVLLETYIGEWTEHWQLLLGFALLGVVLFARGGVMGLIAGRARHD